MPSSDTYLQRSLVRSRLVLTGERRSRRLIVHIDGVEVTLSSTLFDVVVDLVWSRFTTETGYARLRQAGDDEHARVLAYRLRKRLVAVIGQQAASIVETGLGTEYRLSIPAAAISIATSFFELPAGAVACDARKAFAEHCHSLVMHPSCSQPSLAHTNAEERGRV